MVLKRTGMILLICCGMVLPTSSHLNSISYSSIVIQERQVAIEFRYPLINTLELFNADTDGNMLLSQEELDTVKPLMFYYLSNKIKVLSGGRQLQLEIQDLAFITNESESYVKVDLLYRSQKKMESVILLCNVSEETDPYHRHIAQIKLKGKDYLFVFTNTNYFNSADPPAANDMSEPMIPSATQVQSATENQG